MEVDESERPESCLPVLARALEIDLAELEGYWQELVDNRRFLAEINQVIRDVPSFAGKQFIHPAQLRTYRCMLYLFTRAAKPDIFVETGVHNGLGSAFILLALHANRKGVLHSIDLPPVDPRILAQGNRPMPDSRASGWIIPEYLRSQHRLLLGPAQVVLPNLLAELGHTDVFLHDSDHTYHHMMFEMGLGWGYLPPGGWLLCDNLEANASWDDFQRAMGGAGITIHSFNTPSRVWKHGLLKKTRP